MSKKVNFRVKYYTKEIILGFGSHPKTIQTVSIKQNVKPLVWVQVELRSKHDYISSPYQDRQLVKIVYG